MCRHQSYDKLRVLDTTLRDGAQTPHIHLAFSDKYLIAKYLAHVGVDIIEIGFAGNEHEIEGMKKIAKIGSREYSQADDVPIICCFTKSTGSVDKPDYSCIDRAYECVSSADPDKRMLHLFVGTSKELINYRHPKKEAEVLEIIKSSVTYARGLLGNNGYLEFSPEDATRADIDFLIEAAQTAIDNGAIVVNITDTTGFSPPDKYYNTVATLKKNLSRAENVVFSTHVHNDSGNAVATTLKGILAGARQIEGTILQLGERAGNVDWMTVVTNLIVLEDYYKVYAKNIKTSYFYQLAMLVSGLVEQPIPLNFPIMGKKRFF